MLTSCPGGSLSSAGSAGSWAAVITFNQVTAGHDCCVPCSTHSGLGVHMGVLSLLDLLDGRALKVGIPGVVCAGSGYGWVVLRHSSI